MNIDSVVFLLVLFSVWSAFCRYYEILKNQHAYYRDVFYITFPLVALIIFINGLINGNISLQALTIIK